MLEGLDSYALSDLLLFSQETYFRLSELINRSVWPLHVLLLALGLVALYLLIRGDDHGTRTAWGLLGAIWLWVGWVFHLERYATINLAAPYFAALFGFGGTLLLVVGAAIGRLPAEQPTASKGGAAIVIYAVLVHPLTGLAAGRTWTELSYFGLGPDPTAIATLGALLLTGARLRWVAIVPALMWCVMSALTSYAMQSIEAVVPIAAILLSVALSVRWRRTLNAGRR